MDMKDVGYVAADFDSKSIKELYYASKVIGVVDIFIEHDCSQDIESTTIYLPNKTFEDYDFDGDREDNNGSDDEDEDEVERPKENDEPEQSEDEMHVQDTSKRGEEFIEREQEVVGREDEAVEREKVVVEVENKNHDQGEDVVEEAREDDNNDRLNYVFEEGLKSGVEKEAYKTEEQEEADREAEESEEKVVFEEEVVYPDTPLESDEEWEQWENDKKSKRKQYGHIKTGCKNETVVVEKEVRKRGRPSKPTNPNAPPKPSRKKKNQATGSSSQPQVPKRKNKKAKQDESASQPVQSEITSQAVISSSAPEPTTSSNVPKPHVKKAPRGKALKIKKTTTIPTVIGTLWSPFTNCPFEVFGNRSNPQTPQPPQ